jgi:hypothetical protein
VQRLELFLTSVLVLPPTFLRIRFPSAPKPSIRRHASGPHSSCAGRYPCSRLCGRSRCRLRHSRDVWPPPSLEFTTWLPVRARQMIKLNPEPCSDLRFSGELRGFEPLTPSMRSRPSPSVGVAHCS